MQKWKLTRNQKLLLLNLQENEAEVEAEVEAIVEVEVEAIVEAEAAVEVAAEAEAPAERDDEDLVVVEVLEDEITPEISLNQNHQKY